MPEVHQVLTRQRPQLTVINQAINMVRGAGSCHVLTVTRAETSRYIPNRA